MDLAKIVVTGRLAVSAVSIVAAVVVLMNGLDGWGWFLCVGLMLGGLTIDVKTDKT